MEGFLGSELAENADYCMFVNECMGMVSLLIVADSTLGFSFGVRAQTEMKI